MDRAKALSNGYILLFDEKILPAAVQRDFKAVIPAGYAGEHHRLHQEGWGGLVFFLGDPQKVFGSFLQLVLGTRADQIPAGGEIAHLCLQRGVMAADGKQPGFLPLRGEPVYG